MKTASEKTFVARTRLAQCRRPGCGLEVYSRGLCGTDYRVAHGLVRDGLITWDELEQHGKVDRPKRTAKVWFLEYAGRKTN